MPRNDPMKWYDKPEYRWRRMYKGNMLYFTKQIAQIPDHLWGKDYSRPFMKVWFEAQRARIDGATPTLHPIVSSRLQEVEQRIQWARGNDPTLLDELEKQKQAIINAGEEPWELPDLDEIPQEFAELLTGDLLDHPAVRNWLNPQARIWADRLKEDESRPPG